MFAQLKLVKGKINSLKNTCEGVILEANHSMYKYFISYSDPLTLKSGETRWLKVVLNDKNRTIFNLKYCKGFHILVLGKRMEILYYFKPFDTNYNKTG